MVLIELVCVFSCVDLFGSLCLPSWLIVSFHVPVIDLDKVADFRPSDHVLSSLNSSATSSQANTSSVSLGSSLRNSWLVMEVKQVGEVPELSDLRC